MSRTQPTYEELARRLAEAEAALEELREGRGDEALREREDRLSKIMLAANDGSWDWDLVRDSVYYDPRYYEMAGYEVDEFPHNLEEFQKRVHPDDLDGVMEQARLHLSGEVERFLVEFRFRRKEGDWLWIMGRGVIVERDESGAPLRFVGTHTDITERKVVERALQREMAFTETALDSQTDTFFLFDPSTGKALRWNRSFREVSGYTDDEIARMPAPDSYYAPEDLQSAAGFTERVLEEGSGTIELELLTKDGRRVPTEYKVAVVKDDRGEPRYVISIGRDITERRQAEERLRESEERLRIAGRAAYDVIYEWDVTSDTLRWFGDVDGLLGFPEGRVSHDLEAWLGLIHKDDRARLTSAAELHRSSADPIRYEYRVLHSDGAYRHWRDHAFPVLDRGGRPQKWVGACTDITEQKRAEEDRRSLQTQLHHAQKMESVGRLAGGVAHDYNNMLAVIIGRADMLLRGMTPDDPNRAMIEEIMAAAERSATLTSQLLAFARKQTIAPRRIDLNDAVESSLDMLQRVIGEDVELAWRPAPEPCTVNMDPGQLDQILVNLCVNARDAISGHGSITIGTRCVSLDADQCTLHPGVCPGRHAVISVTDDGCGMDEATLTRAFEPFFTTKEAGKGTGLGLSTVYGIVQQNDGDVGVVSESGGGSTVTIHLPCCAGPCGEALWESREGCPRGSGEVVLLVEDEPALLETMSTMLRELGYEVLAAGSPGPALELLAARGGSIDLLITDVVMPDLSGPDLAERVRHSRPDIAVLFVSGFAPEAIAHHGVLEEGGHFIQKPFDLPALARKVREVLSTSR